MLGCFALEPRGEVPDASFCSLLLRPDMTRKDHLRPYPYNFEFLYFYIFVLFLCTPFWKSTPPPVVMVVTNISCARKDHLRPYHYDFVHPHSPLIFTKDFSQLKQGPSYTSQQWVWHQSDPWPLLIVTLLFLCKLIHHHPKIRISSSSMLSVHHKRSGWRYLGNKRATGDPLVSKWPDF